MGDEEVAYTLQVPGEENARTTAHDFTHEYSGPATEDTWWFPKGDTKTAEPATATFENGDKYVGGYLNGKRHGYGTYTWANGDSYEGDWANGVKDGHGTMTYAQAAGEDDAPVVAKVYRGHFSNGKRSGQGVMRYANGDIYNGNWANDQREGQGHYRFEKDAIGYSGHFKGDQFVSGVYDLHNGDYFTGNFSWGYPDGVGTFQAHGGVQEIKGFWTQETEQAEPEEGMLGLPAPTVTNISWTTTGPTGVGVNH